jgi:hypothetical protein
MKVYCPEHKRGFFAPRQNPIKCENRGHILGELDFEGEAKPPIEISWQYCCNCEHFCPIDFHQGGLERCPVCSRRSSTLYLCNRCFTFSFESDTPIQTKNFTITSEGVPQPSCPGCLHTPSTDLREHTCDELEACLFTTLDSCPICLERLDIGPSFPASVAHYLKKTRAASKRIVTFDYESGLFVQVDDGEFVLVNHGDDTTSILLPRSTRFTATRDFYEFYQDYYHCAKPGIGEVYIVEPADVSQVETGWRFQTPGILEVLEDQPKKKAPAVVTVTPGALVPPAVTPAAVLPPAITPAAVAPPAVTPAAVVPPAVTPAAVVPPAITPAAVVPPAITPAAVVPPAVTPAAVVPPAVTPAAVVPPAVTPAAKLNQPDTSVRDHEELTNAEIKRERSATRCTHCSSLVETGYAFCWTCGNPLIPESKHTLTRSEKPDTLGWTPTTTDEQDFTVQHQRNPVGSQIFSWALAREPQRLTTSRSAMLKLLAVVFAGSVFVSLGLFVLVGSASRTDTYIDAQSAAQSAQSAPGSETGQEGDEVTMDSAPLRPPTSPEEDELKRIRARRIAAKASDRPAILQALATTEKQYPNDYRFPYERAKLAIKGTRSHDDAFAALSLAAEKAINNGKAREMLNGLEVDKRRDFQKLSHGHHEWTQLEAALKSNNKSLLNADSQ